MTHGFCILGWYFGEPFYRSVYEVAGDKYIISHRSEDHVAHLPVYGRIRQDLFYCENRGLDWGGYYQFNAMGFYRAYDFIIYCHDDLIINDPDFAAVIADRFRDPHVKVIGNGGNGSDTEFHFSKYRHCMFFQDEDDYLVRTVRGSFFAAKTEIFDRLGNFPVYWKATKKLEKGNISLRNFAYLVTKHFGLDGIGYLDDRSWLNTQYLTELCRGVQAQS